MSSASSVRGHEVTRTFRTEETPLMSHAGSHTNLSTLTADEEKPKVNLGSDDSSDDVDIDLENIVQAGMRRNPNLPRPKVSSDLDTSTQMPDKALSLLIPS